MSGWLRFSALFILCWLAQAKASPPEVSQTTTKPVLQWCLDHLPPRHTYLAGQQPTGPMVDMMRELADASGFTLSFSPPTPLNRCLKLLEEGKTDLMTGLVQTEARQAVYLMSPFDEVRMNSIVVAPHSPVVQREQDLRGRIVVLTKDRTYPPTLLKRLPQLQITVIWGKDLESALALLLYQQADIYMGPQHYTLMELQKNPRFNTLKLNNWQLPADHSQRTHLAMSRLSPHQALWPKIDHALQQMVAANKTHFY